MTQFLIVLGVVLPVFGIAVVGLILRRLNWLSEEADQSLMSRHYAGDPPTALRVVTGTSVVGLFTIPIWIRVGLNWVGGQ
jgi:predicted permease